MQSISLPCILCFLPRDLDLISDVSVLSSSGRAVTQLIILPFPPRITLQTGKGKWKKAPFAAATAVPLPPFRSQKPSVSPFFSRSICGRREGEGKEHGREGGGTDRPMGSLPGDPPPPPPPPPPPASPFPPCCCCCFCSLSHREG